MHGRQRRRCSRLGYIGLCHPSTDRQHRAGWQYPDRAGRRSRDRLPEDTHRSQQQGDPARHRREPNCRPGGSSGSSNIPGTITAIENARAAGFPVYVIGIGTEIGNLDNFAQAGGTGTSYAATSQADLTSALVAISAAASSCAYAVAQPPANAPVASVYVNSFRVPESLTAGWIYGSDKRSIVLTGSYCDTVKAGGNPTVQIQYTCAPAGGATGGAMGTGGASGTGGISGSGGIRGSGGTTTASTATGNGVSASAGNTGTVVAFANGKG